MPAPNAKKKYINLCLRSLRFEIDRAKRIASDLMSATIEHVKVFHLLKGLAIFIRIKPLWFLQ